jgi:monoamine oxidase
MTLDCAVIGAGISGLVAAHRLAQAGKRVLVLEARDRVGGRVYTAPLSSGAPVDLGGQWIGPTHRRIARLAADLGVETCASYTAGYNLLDVRGRVRKYRGAIPRINPVSLAVLGFAVQRLDSLAKKLSLAAPWDHPEADAWDGMTFQTWLDRNMPDPVARAVMSRGLETVYACRSSEISLLHALFYIRSAGSVQEMISTEGGAQESRFVGGAQRVADALAERLGDQLRRSSPVRAIVQSSEDVVVQADGESVRARRAIVALPPPLAGRLVYAPALPAGRDQLCQRMALGTVIKHVGVYAGPFWRDQGLSGQALSDVGPPHVFFDGTSAAGAPGLLVAFSVARAARELGESNEAARRRAFVERAAALFGAGARDPVEYIDKVWAEDEWSRGCYVANMAPGAWTAYGRYLRAPIARIHWAGTETATEAYSYIEGAVQAGERAADEVLAALA